MRAVAATLVGLGLFCAAKSATAYVRSRTPLNTPIYWPGSCVFVQPDSGGTPDLPGDVVFATVQKAMQNWMSADGSCAYLQLHYDAPAPLEAHYDGKNVVKFRTDVWCHPEDAQDSHICYSPAAAAITTVFYLQGGKSDGLIVDADVELNDINFTFVTEPSTTTARPGTEIADLENTLTHELGHLQGLDHTCADASTPANAVDENGQPPPPCDDIPPSEYDKITTATMYNMAAPGETSKRMPKADDVAGICAAYPLAKSPNVCEHVDLGSYQQHGCSMAPAPMAPLGLWLLFGLAPAALVLRRYI